jgi:lactoylglutathione lyase
MEFASVQSLRVIMELSPQSSNPPMRVLELNHVALHVSDLAVSCEFYQTVLRLESLPRPAFDFPGAWFRLGTQQELHLIGGRTELVHSHNRGNHFALRVEGIDLWEQHFQAINAEYRPRKRRPDGAWQIFVRDPDGHMIELFTGA